MLHGCVRCCGRLPVWISSALFKFTGFRWTYCNLILSSFSFIMMLLGRFMLIHLFQNDCNCWPILRSTVFPIICPIFVTKPWIPFCFSGFVGLFTILFLWPGLLILHFAGAEKFEWPDPIQWLFLVANGIIGTVLSELLWLWWVFSVIQD